MADSQYVLGSDAQLQVTTDQTGATNWAQAGIVTEGVMNSDSEVREERAVGDHRPQQLREGLFRVYGNVRTTLYDASILSSAIRVNGRLPGLAFRGGAYQGAPEFITHTYCKIDNMSLEASAGSDVISTIDYKGRGFSQTNSQLQTQAYAAQKAFMWYGTSISGLGDIGIQAGGGGELQPVSFSLRLENAVDWLPVIGNANSPHIRGAKYIREGRQSVSIGMRFLVSPVFDMSALDIAYIPEIVLNFTNGTQNLAVTLSNLKPGPFDRPLRADDLLTNGIQLIATDIAVA